MSPKVKTFLLIIGNLIGIFCVVYLWQYDSKIPFLKWSIIAIIIIGGIIHDLVYITDLQSESINDSMTEVLKQCTDKNGRLIIPNNIHLIGGSVLSSNTKLTSVIIPESVKKIYNVSFRGCANLTSVIIPKSVKKIGKSAFESCPNLTIICPQGSYAERYCKKNSLHFIYDYQYKAFNGLLPPGFKKLASPFLADEEKPFIFISYSHKDRDEVLPIIKTLYESGWKIWYDEGLTIGDSYDETLENHVRDCSAFLLFVSHNSLNSVYCRENEIPWAIRYGKPIIRCILDEGIDYPIEKEAVAATVLPSEAESALEKIEGLSKGEKRTAKGISVVVNPGDRNEEDNEVNEEGFAYCLYAAKNTAVIKAIQLEAKNSGCSLYDASEEGEDSEKLRNSACLVIFLDKAFLADKHLTDILISEYHAGKDMAVCMIENIEDTDLPQELIGLHKMQWLNYAHGISGDMNTKLIRHLQKRGCRNTAVLPGFEYEITDEGIIIKKYTGLDPNPRIESEYDGVPVIAISEMAFSNSSHIKTVTIPDSITEINPRTFENCGGLTSITVPNSIKRIGEEAFKSCASLASITIPDSVTTIEASAFEGCSSLISVIILNGITELKCKIFKDCTSLTSIIIPDSVIYIGLNPFEGCTGLTSIDIPDSMTVIGESAFEGCTGLTSIGIPDSVTEIGKSAFKDCSGLTSIIIPEGITIINEKTFQGCKGLTSITIPDSVTEIEGWAFQGCESLTSIIIPDRVTKIKQSTFYNCTNLTSIIIPDSVTEIDGFAFGYCRSLTSIIIPDGVTRIGLDAFEYCRSLTSINIPKNVKSIEGFRGCSSLISIDIPKGPTGIGHWAFSSCSSLASITIPDSITSIDTAAFQDCKSLNSITIPDSVTKIGRKVFKGCKNLTVTCSPDSETWKYCRKHWIPVSGSNNMINRLAKRFRGHRR